MRRMLSHVSSLCNEAANQDTKEKPREAIYQPDGVSGLSLSLSLRERRY